MAHVKDIDDIFAGKGQHTQDVTITGVTTTTAITWSLLNHGMADIKRLNLGNLNPIYETRGRSDHIFLQETIKT